jgi:hypothetical protein
VRRPDRFRAMPHAATTYFTRYLMPGAEIDRSADGCSNGADYADLTSTGEECPHDSRSHPMRPLRPLGIGRRGVWDELQLISKEKLPCFNSSPDTLATPCRLWPGWGSARASTDERRGDRHASSRRARRTPCPHGALGRRLRRQSQLGRTRDGGICVPIDPSPSALRSRDALRRRLRRLAQLATAGGSVLTALPPRAR